MLGYAKEQLKFAKEPIELKETEPTGYAIAHLDPDHILCECGTELQEFENEEYRKWVCPKCGNVYFLKGIKRGGRIGF